MSGFKAEDTMICIHKVDGECDIYFSLKINDMRMSKPFGFHAQDNNQTGFFQKTKCIDIDGLNVSIVAPNEIALSLSVSKKALKLAVEKRGVIVEVLKNKNSFFDKDVCVFYDFLEEIQKSIIFIYRAIEVFCNSTIPDSYLYKTTSPKKGVVTTYDKHGIERWISTSDKLSEIIPIVLKCKNPKDFDFWNGFKRLEEYRNSIVHSKSNSDLMSDLFSIKIFDYIASGFDLLDYFISLDCYSPTFPLGFGVSKIKLLSLKSYDDIFDEIECL